MADFRVSRRARSGSEGTCPTGDHVNCPITLIRPVSTPAGTFIHARFHFGDTEEPLLELECLDEELAREIAGAVSDGMTIDGLSFLTDLSDPIGKQRKAMLCGCGNNPSPIDGFCRQCRPRQSRGRR